MIGSDRSQFNLDFQNQDEKRWTHATKIPLPKFPTKISITDLSRYFPIRTVCPGNADSHPGVRVGNNRVKVGAGVGVFTPYEDSLPRQRRGSPKGVVPGFRVRSQIVSPHGNGVLTPLRKGENEGGVRGIPFTNPHRPTRCESVEPPSDVCNERIAVNRSDAEVENEH